MDVDFFKISISKVENLIGYITPQITVVQSGRYCVVSVIPNSVCYLNDEKSMTNVLKKSRNSE